MARRMLINAIDPEECRVAIAEDDQIIELETERADQQQLRGNIYKAAITRVEPSLQAAFLDIGSNRNGFLQINDINPTYFNNWPPENGPSSPRDRPAIQDALRSGQDLVVQVVKDERDLKGATLTTNISIPGRYLVLVIGNQRGGVSRKISDEGQRYRLKQAIQKLQIPAGMSVIVRTAGINKSSVELQRDLDALLEIWNEVVEKSFEPGVPQILYKESDLTIRTIRDYLTNEIDEILIDDVEVHRRVLDFVQRTMPHFVSRVMLHDKPQPLFAHFHLDQQVEATNQPEVTLPSGGSVVINVTEAIVAIDVNSGRSTGQSDVEETAFNTNKEAADCVARQLRLRDLGGLIVIDFIDMNDKRHKQVVERVLRDAVRYDKAKVEIGKISKFGLLEMSRQRLRSSLVSQSQMVCPHCAGRGRVRTPESAAIEALRKIQTVIAAGGVTELKVRMSPAAALLLLNNKRQILARLEQEAHASILIYADGRMKPEEYELELVHTRREGGEHGPETVVRSAFERVARQESSPRRSEGGRSEDGRDSDDRGGRNRYGNRGKNRNNRRGGKFRNDNRRHAGPANSSDEPRDTIRPTPEPVMDDREPVIAPAIREDDGL
ncbi:MAG: Rne/Rng family ribonuclease [Deltaproteobacteria bacterium]|nr:Rne/Rng family ribonuclease [Deltaproteobacteria bacterium]